MIIPNKFSPSSIVTLSQCELKWFIQYILGYRGKSGKAMARGIACHAVMEAVAKSKLLRQTGKSWTKDEVFGRIYQKYNIGKLNRAAYDHVVEKHNHLRWDDTDLKYIIKGSRLALEHPLSPENHNEIVDTEQYFMVPMSEEWAQIPRIEDGEIVNKPVNINGIIDLIFRDDDGCLNCLDYKFGERVHDWAKNEKKTEENIHQDIQLCLYYWAIKQKYPNEKIKVVLWYPRANTIFRPEFDQSNIDYGFNVLKESIERLRNITRPSPNYTWACDRMCDFRKHNFDSFDKPELNMPHTPGLKGGSIEGKMCVCDAVNHFFNHRLLSDVVNNCKRGEKNG